MSNEQPAKQLTEKETTEIQKAAEMMSSASKSLADTMSSMVQGLGEFKPEPIALFFDVNSKSNGSEVEFYIESVHGTELYNMTVPIEDILLKEEQIARLFSNTQYRVYTVKQSATNIAKARMVGSEVINLNPDQIDYNGKTIQETINIIRELFNKRNNK